MDNYAEKKNLAIGSEAMWSATTAEGNVALGYKALHNITTGKYNIAIGSEALNDITDENYQIQIGHVRLSGDDPDLAIQLSKALHEYISGPVVGIK